MQPDEAVLLSLMQLFSGFSFHCVTEVFKWTILSSHRAVFVNSCLTVDLCVGLLIIKGGSPTQPSW